MSDLLPQRNLALLLPTAREAVMAHFRPMLNADGLTEQQWHAHSVQRRKRARQLGRMAP